MPFYNRVRLVLTILYQQKQHDNFVRVGVVMANILLIVIAAVVYTNQNATVVLGADNTVTVSVTNTTFMSTTINYTTTSMITNTETSTYIPSPLLLTQTGIKLPEWQEPFMPFIFKVERPYAHVWFTYTIYTNASKPDISVTVRYQIGSINDDIKGQGTKDLALGMGLGNEFTLNLKSHDPNTFIDFEIRGE